MTTAKIYDSFAKHYDKVVGDRSGVATYLHQLIKRYNPRAKSLLELGCGSGSMLTHLSKHYRTVGLDSSKEMLKIARRRAPKAVLRQGDITSFRLTERFDAILCPFDTINHVTSFAKWKKIFSLVHAHLKPGGIFIFDVNTEHKMEDYRLDPVQADVSRDTISIVQVSRSARFRYTVHLKILKRIPKSDNFRLHEMDLPELIVPTPKISHALSHHFSSVHIIDPDRRKPTELSEELYFVCRNPR